MSKQRPENSQCTGQTLSEPIPLVFHPLVSFQRPNQKLILALLSLKQREVVLKVIKQLCNVQTTEFPEDRMRPELSFPSLSFFSVPKLETYISFTLSSEVVYYSADTEPPRVDV